MTQTHVREPNSFGKRKEPHSIVVTRNGRSRHYSVNPVYFSVFVGFLAMFSVGYFAATAYLVLRDDLIDARGARNARMQHEYEDRIAALRTNLDQVTSRQLLDQQIIEAKVAQLIERQKQLGGNGAAMQSIVEKARSFGLDAPKSNLDHTITGAIKPEKQASMLSGISGFGSGFSLRGLGKEQNLALNTPTSPQRTTVPKVRSNENFDYQPDGSLFASVAQSISGIDSDQKLVISALTNSAVTKLTKIATLMKRVGAKFPKEIKSQIGGPYEPLKQNADFSDHLEALNYSLVALDTAKGKISTLPVANPVPGKTVSSRFGSRVDPFKGKVAMHSGMDFRANYGVGVLATASGKVIHAGRKGGYGNMVEIKHANGVTTRYAHLSKILVKKGQRIKAGTRIGKVGSTGRSTGPHLHYEVRIYGVAVNPNKYLLVGKKLLQLL